MALLSGGAEIRYASPYNPDARGEVRCVVDVLAHPEQGPAAGSSVVTVTFQAVAEVDLSKVPELSPGDTRSRLAREAEELLKALPGSGDVQARVVASRPARAPRP
ncbi:hypothetical protein ACIO6T_30790 [Streptomyces sp. NPDC087532]|uniref:hypothetical protein n=1 Tax=Streptomyces sp. NPDC087532 TaxID=3365795 RepID=UPI003817A9C4